MRNLINNVKIAFRNAQKNSILSFAKLFGISISFVVILFSAGYVYYETSFDKCIPGYDKMYRCIMKGQIEGKEFDCAVTSSKMAKGMVDDIPEIKETVRLKNQGEVSIQYNEEIIKCGNLLLADPGFFSFFSIPIKKTLKNIFETANNIAIAKSLAIQYFGSVDGALNKSVKLNNDNCIIIGVFDDFPKNFHLQNKIVQSLEKSNPESNSWTAQSYYTYFKTKTLISNIDNLSFKLTKLVYLNSGESIDAKKAKTWEDLKYSLDSYVFYLAEPLTDIHFSIHRFDPAVTASKTYVYGAIILSILILLISSINFINLTISNISTRIKEIGIRKTNGAHNKQIAFQFLAESIIFWLVGFFIALALYLTIGKILATYLEFDINISNSTYWKIVLYSFLGLLIFNIITSIIPITVVSNKRILGLLKNADAGEKHFSLKNCFVCLQFILSALIILSSLLVQKQINFIINKDRGYDTENVMILSGWTLNQEKRKTLINELKAYPVVKSVSTSDECFGYDPSMTSAYFETYDQQNYFHTSVFQVDDEFINTFNLKLLQGRFFEKDRKTDFNTVVLNETAYKEYTGKGSVFGKKLLIDGSSFEIIGIVKDFNFRSLYYKIQPLVIRRIENMGTLYIKINNNHINEAVGIVKTLWNKYNASAPIDYTFHDELIVSQYKKDMQAKKLLNILSVISVIIACVGLYAISFSSIIKKTKEIGVRKVSGAKISEVVLMLNVDFIKWVIMAFVIATPIAWYLMNKWLNSFAYKTELSWWIFLLAGAIAVFVAIVTVSWQSYRAATRNPVEALRYE